MTLPPPAIAPEQRTRITGELDRMAAEHGVRIVLAVESGSRAWGFPSPDSDYDVRFLYVRPMADYLAVFPPRDIIERPIAADLDISGWDLRKALQLAAKSNAVLIEWLASPLRYHEQPDVTEELRRLVHRAARRPALAYHYHRLAWHALVDIQAGTGLAQLKRLFYALRPALALAWIHTHGAPPPMDLLSLMSGVAVPHLVTEVVETLVALKASSGECRQAERVPVLETFLEQVLATPAGRPVSEEGDGQVVADMAAWFRTVLEK